MNKTQLIDVVAKSADLKKKEAELAVSAALDAIAAALADGDLITLLDVQGRLGRSPVYRNVRGIASVIGNRTPLDDPGNLQEFIKAHISR